MAIVPEHLFTERHTVQKKVSQKLSQNVTKTFDFVILCENM